MPQKMKRMKSRLFEKTELKQNPHLENLCRRTVDTRLKQEFVQKDCGHGVFIQNDFLQKDFEKRFIQDGFTVVEKEESE